MAKIPFDIKYRPQIESGEYKVETRDGRPVRIICWDAKRRFGDSICGFMWKEEDCPYFWQPNGSWWADYTQSPKDLFIITPEPELSEFERELSKYLCDASVRPEPENYDALAREYAPQPLELAKKEIEKDLPRWKTIKKDDNAIARIPHVGTNMLGERMLYIGENAISISCLMKLPGFKED